MDVFIQIIQLLRIHLIDVSVEAESESNAPSDISPFGTLKNIESQVLRLPPGHQFPVNADRRKFQQRWLTEYVWIEFSISRDAIFCYACRQFSSKHDRDNVFKETGYSQWKSALDSGKGIKKHQSCAMHLNSMAKWADTIKRQKTNPSVVELGSGNVLQYRRNYMKKVIEVGISIHELFQYRLINK